MTINFLPNDPLAVGALPMRQKAPRPNRPANRAGFTFTNAAAEGQFALGTPELLFWQCREACLAAVEAFESFAGNLTQWSPFVTNPRRLSVFQNAGLDLNAFYDRDSVSFFEFTTGNKTTLGGQSTDVVSHEVGHAFLDSLRPELFDDGFVIEIGAFHEAFGDCMALLTGLSDLETRKAVLASAQGLRGTNFLETLAEDLSDGILREKGAQHPASKPRHALNTFKWQLPSTLPPIGPPNVMIGEIHSFGRIFLGCFYDTISNIFNTGPAKTEAALLKAAVTAAKLLVAAAQAAPLANRFFRSVGRSMILADQQQNNGANRDAIRQAFQGHNIALGTAAMLTPTTALSGTLAHPRAAAGPTLSAAARKDLMNRMSAKAGEKMAVTAVDLFGQRLTQVQHRREVPLGKISKKLSGVVCYAGESALLDAVDGRAAVVGALPEENATVDEVSAYVKTLIAHDRIAYGDKKSAVSSKDASHTHVVRREKGKKVLRRIRFLCGPGICHTAE
jgi:hypothetical protein